MSEQNNKYAASLVTVGSFNAPPDSFYFLSASGSSVVAGVTYYNQYSKLVGESEDITISATVPTQCPMRDGVAYFHVTFASDIRFVALDLGGANLADQLADFAANKSRFPGLAGNIYGRSFGNAPGGVN